MHGQQNIKNAMLGELSSEPTQKIVCVCVFYIAYYARNRVCCGTYYTCRAC